MSSCPALTIQSQGETTNADYLFEERVPFLRPPLRVSEGNSLVALPRFVVYSFALQSSATTLVYKSFNDLMKEADGVVSGHVASVDSQYNANREIYTFVTLDQLEVLSGTYQDSTLTIRLKGGKVENDISHVIGSPEFAEGDRVVLFVNGNGRYMVPLVGWTQGVFRIRARPCYFAGRCERCGRQSGGGRAERAGIRDLVVHSEATILKQAFEPWPRRVSMRAMPGSSDSKPRSEPVPLRRK